MSIKKSLLTGIIFFAVLGSANAETYTCRVEVEDNGSYHSEIYLEVEASSAGAAMRVATVGTAEIKHWWKMYPLCPSCRFKVVEVEYCR